MDPRTPAGQGIPAIIPDAPAQDRSNANNTTSGFAQRSLLFAFNDAAAQTAPAAPAPAAPVPAAPVAPG